MLNNLNFKHLRRNETFLLILFFAFFIYQFIGVFPIAPFEGDGLGIANGAKQIALSDLGPKPLAYRYSVQSGTYALIVFVHRFTGLNTLVTFSLLSAFSGAGFILIAAAFLKQITSFSYAICGLVVLFFQEAFASGYYANSTVIAAAFAILALYTVTSSNRPYMLILAGVCLGLGAWMRFDALLVAPVMLLLAYHGSWKQALYRTSLVALSTVIVSLSAIYYSGSTIDAIFSSANARRSASTGNTPGLGIPFLGSADIKSHMAFFSAVLLFLIAVGIFTLIRTKNWYLLGVFLAGVMPLYIAYFGKITTPKYMYYLIPFFGMPVLLALAEIKPPFTKRRRVYLSIIVSLFLIQYILGIQVSFMTKPYIKNSHPIFFTLFKTDVPIEAIDNIAIIIGGGTQISTADGDRLSSGILFAPLTWLQMKTEINTELKKIHDFIRHSGNQQLNFLTTQYQSRQFVLFILLDNEYDCKRQDNLPVYYVCTKDDFVAILTDQSYTGRNYSNIEKALSLVNACKVIFFPGYSWEKDLFLKNAENWREISTFAYEIQKCASP